MKAARELTGIMAGWMFMSLSACFQRLSAACIGRTHAALRWAGRETYEKALLNVQREYASTDNCMRCGATDLEGGFLSLCKRCCDETGIRPREDFHAS